MSLPSHIPPSPPPQPEPLMTPAEVATFLRISRTTLYKLRRSGALKAKRMGSLYRFHPDVVRAFALGETATVHQFPRRQG